MLHAHALLVAAIFTTYMGLMAGLFTWICRTGRRGEPEDPGEGPLPARAAW